MMPTDNSAVISSRQIYRIGGTVIHEGEPESRDSSTPPAVAHERTIRFPDDEISLSAVDRAV